ncbi:MAG: prenyltransferase/squalene oxidase repeat-containing protein [Verrucomicrobiales bacterium]|nr:prenyltransferase/squalene oxidase repeat-containing protein [Verrucomicrobiales bacterium]
MIEALQNARRRLLEERVEAGHWEGELSTSALSTATALVALGCVDSEKYKEEVFKATGWLIANQNDDGGWGDTTKSFSNISTTLLCWSALTRFGGDAAILSIDSARSWIRDYVGSMNPGLIAETVKARYGKDRTFSVPILMLCAICGTLGPKGWRLVLRLPFELAAFPREWFAIMRLPVVSYALPALIAIGYAGYRKSWAGCFPHPFWPRVSRLLEEIQPSSGGFLEAAPLTSFVTMALVAAGENDHPVVKRSVHFLLDTVRADGSWPIDTNLATWSTTLSVKALAETQEGQVNNATLSERPILFEGENAVLDWLLGQQYEEVHPFTNSAPGGWAWTDLSGGVPDADDTPGALLAIDYLDRGDRAAEIQKAAGKGVVWLLDLQNRDGGIPTFCRGWGALPFDRSSEDLTAHTLRAWHQWQDRMSPEVAKRIEESKARALRYLKKKQRADGSWSPLWFGNQYRIVDEENPTYGTAMVVRALDEIGEVGLADRGAGWLIANQNMDGGWGAAKDVTPSTIEETALAVASLAWRREALENVTRGVAWLLQETGNGTRFIPSPIGFYFARLWYFERSYPIIWTVEALGRAPCAGLPRS